MLLPLNRLTLMTKLRHYVDTYMFYTSLAGYNIFFKACSLAYFYLPEEIKRNL